MHAPMGEATRRVPPVLLLHGQPGGAADWAGVIGRLDGHARALAFDRPGWDGATPPADLEGNVRAAIATLDAHRVDRALVVGHSLGGAIAAWLGAAHPERVAALVLVAPAANRAALYRVDRWLAAPVAGELVGAVTLGGVGLALSLRGPRRWIAAATGVEERYLSSARRAMLRPGAWRAYASEQRTLVRELPALEARLDAIRAPTTILSGSDDHIVPPRAARELARQIAGARLIVSEHAGHLLPQAAPGLVADAVIEAVSRAQTK